MPGMAAAEAVRRAESYPFDLPFGSFRYREGIDHEFDGVEADRHPVLAIGSNGSPSQLASKFGICPEGIPVTRAVLVDRAVVYSAHFAAYGSLPATLTRAPGCRSWVFVTWLTDAQMAAMHSSEGIGGRYDFVRLESGEVDDETAGRLDGVGCYLSRAGALAHDGSAIRIAEVPTTGCPLPALTQRAALHWAHRRVAATMSYEIFIERLVGDASFRRASNVALRRFAIGC
ncbi:MAG TPA: hypothetical protein PKA13_20550 [Geminicoccaceae bacterium]|nr:hypothetical protein [Geminicoccus sp.]HMU52180.1 hypothetical protein [Geminicoccaceae bacterium]